jgi:hypothetical protein
MPDLSYSIYKVNKGASAPFFMPHYEVFLEHDLEQDDERHCADRRQC